MHKHTNRVCQRAVQRTRARMMTSWSALCLAPGGAGSSRSSSRVHRLPAQQHCTSAPGSGMIPGRMHALLHPHSRVSSVLCASAGTRCLRCSNRSVSSASTRACSASTSACVGSSRCTTAKQPKHTLPTQDTHESNTRTRGQYTRTLQDHMQACGSTVIMIKPRARTQPSKTGSGACPLRVHSGLSALAPGN